MLLSCLFQIRPAAYSKPHDRIGKCLSRVNSLQYVLFCFHCWKDGCIYFKHVLQPTASPTTASPTTASPTSSTLPLQNIGNNGSPAGLFPLGQCQGDCDRDLECQVCITKTCVQQSFTSFIDLIPKTPLCLVHNLLSQGGPFLPSTC